MCDVIWKVTGMRRLGRGSFLAVVSLAALLAALVSTTTLAAPSVFVNPNTGPAGTVVLVSGLSFPTGHNVRVSWDDASALGNGVVDANGAFAVQVTIPADASAGEHSLRVAAWVGQFLPVCIATTSDVGFTVTVPGEPEPTASAGEPTATTSPPVTVTDPACATATATSTATATASATATSSVTVTVTSTSTATATRTPTKTGLPRTGSAGLLGTDDSDGGPGASAYVALALLGGGLALTGSYVLRQRRAS
jgi:hypothetical protein